MIAKGGPGGGQTRDKKDSIHSEFIRSIAKWKGSERGSTGADGRWPETVGWLVESGWLVLLDRGI